MNAPVVDFQKARDRRDAGRWRELQAKAYLQMFDRAHGRPAWTIHELEVWLSSVPDVQQKCTALIRAGEVTP